MDTVMMKPTMLTAIMTVETVVAVAYLKLTALNVNALMLSMELLMYSLEMVHAMMKPTTKSAAMMVETVVIQQSIQSIAQSVYAITRRLVPLEFLWIGLVMATAMMKLTFQVAILMGATVVVLVTLQITARIVNVLVELQVMEHLIFLFFALYFVHYFVHT